MPSSTSTENTLMTTADVVEAFLTNTNRSLANAFAIMRMASARADYHRHVCPEGDGGCGEDSLCNCLDTDPDHEVQLCDDCRMIADAQDDARKDVDLG